MQSSTVEVEWLGDLFRDDAPCEAELAPFDSVTYCCKPSVVKIYRECPCGLKSTRYLCKQHFDELRAGTIGCSGCNKLVTDWKTI